MKHYKNGRTESLIYKYPENKHKEGCNIVKGFSAPFHVRKIQRTLSVS